MNLRHANLALSLYEAFRPSADLLPYPCIIGTTPDDVRVVVTLAWRKGCLSLMFPGGASKQYDVVDALNALIDPRFYAERWPGAHVVALLQYNIVSYRASHLTRELMATREDMMVCYGSESARPCCFVVFNAAVCCYCGCESSVVPLLSS